MPDHSDGKVLEQESSKARLDLLCQTLMYPFLVLAPRPTCAVGSPVPLCISHSLCASLLVCSVLFLKLFALNQWKWPVFTSLAFSVLPYIHSTLAFEIMSSLGFCDMASFWGPPFFCILGRLICLILPFNVFRLLF